MEVNSVFSSVARIMQTPVKPKCPLVEVPLFNFPDHMD